MENINLTPLIQALISLLAVIVTCYAIPWIKAHTTEKQQENLHSIVRVLVCAAEQIFGAGKGEEKLEYVCEKLREKGYDVDIPEIEAEVYEQFNSLFPAIRPAIPAETEEAELKQGEAEINDDYDLPPLEDWPLDMLDSFCKLNGIPHEGCVTREDYFRAITQAGNKEPPDAEQEV